jgi:hypothetical protein
VLEKVFDCQQKLRVHRVQGDCWKGQLVELLLLVVFDQHMKLEVSTDHRNGGVERVEVKQEQEQPYEFEEAVL